MLCTILSLNRNMELWPIYQSIFYTKKQKQIMFTLPPHIIFKHGQPWHFKMMQRDRGLVLLTVCVMYKAGSAQIINIPFSAHVWYLLNQKDCVVKTSNSITVRFCNNDLITAPLTLWKGSLLRVNFKDVFSSGACIT